MGSLEQVRPTLPLVEPLEDGTRDSVANWLPVDGLVHAGPAAGAIASEFVGRRPTPDEDFVLQQTDVEESGGRVV